jgi:hypothetical protein
MYGPQQLRTATTIDWTTHNLLHFNDFRNRCEVSRSLSDIAALTSELEAQVKERSRIPERLQADADRYQELAALKKDEADALVKPSNFRAEIAKCADMRSTWQSTSSARLFNRVLA